MYEFDYKRPKSLGDAESAIKAGGKLLAGGQTLIPTMKLRLNRPEVVIDLGGVADLKGIRRDGASLVIGAMETHAAVAASPAVKEAVAGLAALAGGIGDPHVRHRGTIGGSIANNDPAADYPAAMLALGATMHTSKRALPADQFFTGLFTTALAEDEILLRVAIPTGQKFAYAKFRNPASRYALVGVAVAQGAAGPRVAVTGAGSSGVFRVPAMEAALAKSFAGSALAGIKVDAGTMMSDMHADAAYRAHLVGVMAKRAVVAAGGAA